MEMSFVSASQFRIETKFVAKRRLANLLLVWTSVSSSFQNLLYVSRTFAFSAGKHPQHGLCPLSKGLAFVPDHENEAHHRYRCHSRTISPIDLVCSQGCRTKSILLAAGSEKRIFPSADQQQEQYTYNTQDQRRRIEKAVRTEGRILFLESKLLKEEAVVNSRYSNKTEIDADLTDAEKAELEGLLRAQLNYEERYDPQKFSEEHLEFKAIHNDVFARLVRWCEEERDKLEETDPTTMVFFLDGPDGGTASSLIERGNFCPDQCYVANRHESTCGALRQSGGGLLPEGNVVHATASEALAKGAATGTDTKQGALAQLEFTGFYFDGCNGDAPDIIKMMSSALLVSEHNLESPLRSKQTKVPRHPIAVGYSLLGDKKSLIEKELEVSRALTLIARSRGMRVVHALDDPSRFDLPPSVPKLGGTSFSTFTTWLILQPEHQ